MEKENASSSDNFEKTFAQFIIDRMLSMPDRIAPENIPDRMPIQDTTVYQWSIQLIHPSFLKRLYFFFTSFAGACLGALLLIAAPLTLVSLFFPTIALWVSVIAAGVLLFFFLIQHGIAYGPISSFRIMYRFRLPFFSILPTVALGCLLVSSGFQEAFQGSAIATFKERCFVLLDTLLDTCLIGIPQTFGLVFSQVQPSKWYTSLTLAAIKVTATVGVFDLIVLLYHLAINRIDFDGTVKDAAFACHPLIRFPGILVRSAKIESLSKDETVSVDSFRKTYPLRSLRP